MHINNKKYYKELSEKIESGEYFIEARDWYLRKYMSSFWERSYVILFIFLIIILLLFSYTYYSAILPIKKSLPIKVNISSAAEFSTRITYLGNKQKDFDINKVFIQYFSGRFVEAIESYDSKNNFSKLKISRNIIDTLASGDILSYYIDKISIRNPDSITLKYRKKFVRIITVDRNKIEFAEVTEDKIPMVTAKKNKGDDIKYYQTTVNFDATELNRETGERTVSSWQAKIILSFQTIKYNYEIKDFTPLNFKVLSYESKKIN